jgi:hypothetical protein
LTAIKSLDRLDQEIRVPRLNEQTPTAPPRPWVWSKSAASKRYTRALQRLKEILAALDGETSEERP